MAFKWQMTESRRLKALRGKSIHDLEEGSSRVVKAACPDGNLPVKPLVFKNWEVLNY